MFVLSEIRFRARHFWKDVKLFQQQLSVGINVILLAQKLSLDLFIEDNEHFSEIRLYRCIMQTAKLKTIIWTAKVNPDFVRNMFL